MTPLAVLMLADEIAETMIFKDGVRLDMDYCLENIKSREQVSEMQRAYDHFIDACTINRSKFDDGDYGDTWGVWRGDYIYIIPAALELIAKQYNFSVKQFVEWCKNECLLDYDKGEKRNKKRIQLGGDYKKRIRCYGIRSSMDGAKIANDDDFIPGEPDMESEEPLPFALP